MNDNQLMYAFGKIVNAMGGGGNKGQSFPESDADDFSNGARFIPSKVTYARRSGEKVIFIPTNTSGKWQMEQLSLKIKENRNDTHQPSTRDSTSNNQAEER